MTAVLQLLAIVSVAAATVASADWGSPAGLATVPPADLQTFLQLIGNATTLSYTSTFGSYYRPWDANATLPQAGWTRHSAHNPPFGMHAVAFVNHAETKLLVAFRGTDLNVSGVSGQADVCADYYLWTAEPPTVPASPQQQQQQQTQPPPYCANFTWDTLDYFTTARQFAQQAAIELPGYSILYTGHSLGAGLAALMALLPLLHPSANCSAPVAAGAVAFASPNVLFALQHRLASLNLTGSQLSQNVAIFADAYDPVQVHSFNAPAHGMIGSLWWYSVGSTPPLPCYVCVDVERAETDSLDCLLCMSERHIFSHYVEMIRAGDRPTFTQRFNDCSEELAACTAVPNVSPICDG
jgi:hypothetical protein